jgi:restriction system protein
MSAAHQQYVRNDLMAEFVIEVCERQQRYVPDALYRATGYAPRLLGRLKFYTQTGRHLPELSSNSFTNIWASVYQEGGASAHLVDTLNTVLDSWLVLVEQDADFVREQTSVRLKKGDRFVLQGHELLLHATPVAPYCRAKVLDAVAERKLLGAAIGLEILDHMHEDGHRRRTRLVEALARHQLDVVAIVSQPRLWLADGQIHTKKTLKLLRDKVSESLGQMEDAELQAIAKLWRDNGSRPTASSTSARGSAFEVEIAQLFSACGFSVETTPVAGDFGVDLVLQDGDTRIAVQVKNLAAPAGVAAIQEVSAGALHYRCPHKLVVSSNGFTEAAQVLATSTGTRLETEHSLRAFLRQQVLRRLRG